MTTRVIRCTFAISHPVWGLYHTLSFWKFNSNGKTSSQRRFLGKRNASLFFVDGGKYDKSSNYLVQYSFRIEEISENRCSNIYDVTYVFSRNSSERKYNTITYGNQNTITNLPENINEEREITGRQKVVRGSNVSVLTSHVGLNPRSKSGYEREARVIKNNIDLQH